VHSRPSIHPFMLRVVVLLGVCTISGGALRVPPPSAATTKPLKAAIIGGGLGGLTAAIALRKVGIDAHVYERRSEIKGTVGTGLTMWPNGLSALEAIDPGLAPLIVKAGASTKLIEVTTADGQTKLPNPTGDPTRFPAMYGQPMLNIHWARLQQCLASRLPAECLHLDCSFAGLESASGGGGGVTLEFARASGEALDPVTADFAVGADGINSVVRGLLVDDGPPRDAGRTIWRSIIPFEDVDEELLLRGGCSMSAGAGKVGFLTDLGAAGLYWSAFATDEALAASGVNRDATDDIQHYLLEEFGGVYKVALAIKSTPPSMILERRVADRVPLVDDDGRAAIPWRGLPVTLLGDAFHAMIPSLGQGANSSFEGAYRLAAALAGASEGGMGVEEALRAYESAQMERVHWIVERSAAQGKMVYEDRDEFMRKQQEAQDEMWGVTFEPLGVAA